MPPRNGRAFPYNSVLVNRWTRPLDQDWPSGINKSTTTVRSSLLVALACLNYLMLRKQIQNKGTHPIHPTQRLKKNKKNPFLEINFSMILSDSDALSQRLHPRQTSSFSFFFFSPESIAQIEENFESAGPTSVGPISPITWGQQRTRRPTSGAISRTCTRSDKICRSAAKWVVCWVA